MCCGIRCSKWAQAGPVYLNQVWQVTDKLVPLFSGGRRKQKTAAEEKGGRREKKYDMHKSIERKGKRRFTCKGTGKTHNNLICRLMNCSHKSVRNDNVFLFRVVFKKFDAVARPFLPACWFSLYSCLQFGTVTSEGSVLHASAFWSMFHSSGDLLLLSLFYSAISLCLWQRC